MISPTRQRIEPIVVANDSAMRLLERFFAGDWQTDIVVLAPGEPIGIGHVLGIGESHD